MDGGTRALDGATQAKGQDADKQTRQRHGQADPREELQLEGVLGRRNTLMLELMGERDRKKKKKQNTGMEKVGKVRGRRREEMKIGRKKERSA